ncbi:related to nonribosomal peptide synthetase MxcG [Fusarium oxysporum]|uniref:Related to nonribosomal peptide synthetase MxcG n=1 Tax=Fusarium oxysporum TaxID=5507 RepID=A0A2H3TA98_FUSOX|nr:related to nonribosomal peptide synthetase MxcG [Fusarium oxysporum]
MNDSSEYANIVETMTIRHDSNAVEAHKPAVQPSQAKLFTLDEMIKRRAVELGDTILMGAPETGVDDFKEHSAVDIDRYADAAVARLQSLGLEPVDPTLEKAPVVGMLGQSGIHVVIQIIALNRLGYSSFLISTRLASPAITQLLTLADCNVILTTPPFHPVLKEVQQNRQLEILPLLQSADIFHHNAPRFVRDYSPEAESRKVAVIIHSSGSTGLPKPIYLTNSSCIGAFAVHMNMRAFLTSPFFHSHGFYEVFRSIYSGKPIYFTNYGLPLTRETVMAQLKATKPEIFHCVPYVIKLLAESDEGIQMLADMKLVLYAGSGCPDDLGDRLVERGVNLCGNYGATETGRLATSARPEGDKAWNYIRVLPPAEPYTIFDEVAPGLFECVALDGLPSKSTTNSDNPPGSFRTRDLFTQHPTRPNLWKFACRLDDRFTLINGEKVLPIPIEGRIRQEEIVKEAIVFGDGRTYPGILIVKADRVANMPDDEFLDAIWPSVEDANSRAESFSRIPKELVVIVPADSSYPRTDKGTFIRVPTYRQFEKEIEAAYNKYEGQGDEAGSLTLEGSELEDYLLQQLKSKCGADLESSEADFFASGVDSLQCIQMWSLIKREIDLGGRQSELGQNVLYETGNVKLLARQLERLRSGANDETQDQLKIMEGLIEKYSSFERHVPGSEPQPEKELVLLTGVTGALGAHALAQLTARPNVGAVWALVRAASDTAATERLHSSLQARGLSLDEEQRSKVLALPCDLSRPDLGLSESHISELRSKLTTIIHSAWAVNFNISVQSFEDQHIKAVHNLIQLSLSVQTPKPARFFFCSSVSSAGGSPRPGKVLEAQVPSPAHAQHTGYARSKYVAEHITGNACKNAGAVARVLRLGQLVGDTKVGEWNTTEGIPLMIQTAVTLGALPALNEEMTWLPVDLAASTILDLAKLGAQSPSDRSSDPDLVYHILNPVRFHWANDMLPSMTKAGFKFETLPTDQWMDRLRNSERDPAKNPPIKLLDWFEGKYGNKAASSAEKGPLDYLTDKSREDSETLRNVPDVTNVEYVKMMLGRLQARWAEKV